MLESIIRECKTFAYLLHAVGILPDVLPDLLVHLLLVRLAGQLDQKVAGVHLEHAGQELVVVNVLAVDAVAVAAGAGVDADVLALVGGEAVEDLVVQVDECLEQVGAGPRVARVLLRGQTTLGEVDADALRAGLEGAADVLLALVDQVLDELLLRIALDLAYTASQP